LTPAPGGILPFGQVGRARQGFLGEAAQLEIFCDVVVERSTPFPRQDFHKPWAVPYPVTYDVMETAIASAYQQSVFPHEAATLCDWVDRQLPIAVRSDAEEMMMALCASIKRDIEYLRRSEKGVQSPSQTLQYARGSCRDMATLMLEAARSLGIASRFVSGYLHCAASEAGRASTHAWMEAYLPALGWRGFDPTLGESADREHVPTGVSHHPRGVMPISGIYSGDRADFREMIVQVQTEALEAGD